MTFTLRGLLLLSTAVVMLLAGASYAGGARADESPLHFSGIQIHPKRPNIVYASTLGNDTWVGGVYKSTDAGKTWSTGAGLTQHVSTVDAEHLRVDALALDPRSPDVLFAGTGLGVFKTTDGARTWELASTGIDFGGDPLGHRLLEGFVWAIAIDPMTSTVYAAGNGVWKSTNGGATWKRVLANGVVNLGIDPRQPETVYASGIKDFRKKATRNSIFKTVNGGGSWRATGPRGLHDGYFGHPIVVDRRAPGIVYAGGSRGLYATANQGRTWKKLLARGIGAIALHPLRANVLYVGTGAHGIFKSNDGGETWSEPRLFGRSVSAIAIAPTQPQTIYAGVQWETSREATRTYERHGGLFASRDGGATWLRVF